MAADYSDSLPVADEIVTERPVRKVRYPVVTVFARMQPPTKGHERVLAYVQHIAAKRRAPVVVFLSPKCGDTDNPLTSTVRLRFLRRMFPGLTFVSDARLKTPLDAMQYLVSKRADGITLVCGSDRTAAFQKLGKYLKLRDYDVATVPQMRNDDDDIAKVSASDMRTWARTDNFALFRQGLPTRCDAQLAKEIFDAVRGLHRAGEQREGHKSRLRRITERVAEAARAVSRRVVPRRNR